MLRPDRRTDGGNVHHPALVPVFYAICVLDLKIVKWETPAPPVPPLETVPVEKEAAEAAISR